ncbi:Ion channel [Promicromonospora umidemergens]|uniref:Potassium channel domain-containing protein n=1 Tax=Promicromonospora umidemergens TaxID=629679 RepID=A0ABP8XPE2_9MICO|nr:potassium channel family protein [Promicromonospora umidemergens]MCP2282085.1 Ion channel [Promicromonospora umidemergens]
MVVTVVATGVGVVLVLAALRDVFQTLLHPSGRGRISVVVTSAVWWSCHRLGTRAVRLSGPAAMVVVTVVWVGLIVLGWALVYWPHMGTAFSYSTSLEPTRRSDFVDAFYVSVVTLTTLGFGDVVPAAWWLRLVAPVEGLIGFALLSAGVSWILEVYPALARRRAVALHVHGLCRMRTVKLLGGMEPGVVAQILRDLAAGIDRIRVDFMQYEVIYYFADPHGSTSLAAMAGYVLELSAAAQESGSGQVRHAGGMLDVSVAGLAEVLDSGYLHTGGTTATVLAAYGRAQRAG